MKVTNAVKPPPGMVNLLEESLRWSRDHKGETYRHALPCEWCLQQGLCHAIAELTGQTAMEVREFYTEKISKEKKPRGKGKVVRRRQSQRKVVVRRKK